MSEAVQQFVDSYERIAAREKPSADFFDTFYDAFIAASPIVAEKFRHTDMARQKKMLELSLNQMVYFAIDREETAELARVADIHGPKGVDIPAALYDLWLDSLVSTVARFDPAFNEIVDSAWRHALQPGIEYMRGRHSRASDRD